MEKTPVKTEKTTPEEKKKKTPVAKISPKKTSPKEKSTKKKDAKTKKKSPTQSKLSPTKDKVSPTKIKNETSPSTSTDAEKASIADEDIKTESSPSPTKKISPPINPFFLSSKQAKEQSAGGAAPTGVDYNPGKTNYHPIKDAFWKHGEK